MQLPLRNQENEATIDGQPDENKDANCVPASLSSAVSWFIGRDVYGDELKDAVYGQGFQGGTDPVRYIPYLAAHYGIKMWEVNGNGDQLVAAIKDGLSKGCPVTAAIPSMWGNTTAADIAAHGGSTHEIIFQDDSNGQLTAMNPWPVDGKNAFYQTMPESWWSSRLVYGRVFILQGEVMSFPKGVPAGWSDDGTTLKAPNGQSCQHGVRDTVLGNGWDPANMPQAGEVWLDVADPTDPKAGPGGRQYFLNCLICWIKAANQMRIVPGGAAALALSNAPVVVVDDSKRKALEAVVSTSISQLQAGLQAAL